MTDRLTHKAICKQVEQVINARWQTIDIVVRSIFDIATPSLFYYPRLHFPGIGAVYGQGLDRRWQDGYGAGNVWRFCADWRPAFNFEGAFVDKLNNRPPRQYARKFGISDPAYYAGSSLKDALPTVKLWQGLAALNVSAFTVLAIIEAYFDKLARQLTQAGRVEIPGVCIISSVFCHGVKANKWGNYDNGTGELVWSPCGYTEDLEPVLHRYTLADHYRPCVKWSKALLKRHNIWPQRLGATGNWITAKQANYYAYYGMWDLAEGWLIESCQWGEENIVGGSNNPIKMTPIGR